MSEKMSEQAIFKVTNLPTNPENGATYVIDQHSPSYLTHSFFKYPCKFIPEIPKWAIKKYSSNQTIVYDPFVGSGTTLLEGKLHGLDAIGREIAPIALLVSKVKTHLLQPIDFLEIDKIVSSIEKKVSQQKNFNHPFLPKINNLYHWFDKETVEILGYIKGEIDSISNIHYKDFLDVCFISIIRKCSRADDVSPKPYVSTKVTKAPRKPLDEFVSTYKAYKSLMIKLAKLAKNSKVDLVQENPETAIQGFKTNLVVTSPPYINAFDYVRILRLENLWLGYNTEDELRNNKKDYIGTEKISKEFEQNKLEILSESFLLEETYKEIFKVDEKRALIVKKFFDDIKKNLIEIKNILSDDGRYCIVIGNNNIRNITVDNWKIISEIAQNLGYKKELYFSYAIQNPYLRIPRKGLGGKIKKDFVLVLKNGR